MRLGEYGFTYVRHPPAQVSVAVLEKIDRPVVLICPAVDGDFSPVLVDRHKRSGTQYRMHRPVVQADKSIPISLYIRAIGETQRHSAPPPHQMIKKSGFIQVDFKILGLINGHLPG